MYRKVGPWTNYRLLSSNTTNATAVKSKEGIIGGWNVTNTNAAARYLKLYDKASAPSETDTPIATITLPPSVPVNVVSDEGLYVCANGIGFRTTTGAADNDTNAVAANEIVLNLFYA